MKVGWLSHRKSGYLLQQDCGDEPIAMENYPGHMTANTLQSAQCSSGMYNLLARLDLLTDLADRAYFLSI